MDPSITSMLVHARRVNDLFPDLACELRRAHRACAHRVVDLGMEICSSVHAYMDHVVAQRSKGDGELIMARDLVRCTEAFESTLLPKFTEEVGKALADPELADLAAGTAFECLICGLHMLTLDDLDWPPSRKVGPRLLRGILTFFRASVSRATLMTTHKVRHLVSMLAAIVSWMMMRGLDATILCIPPAMFAQMYALACLAVHNQDRSVQQDSNTHAALRVMLVCWSKLTHHHTASLPQGHASRMVQASQAPAAQLARLSTIMLGQDSSSSTCTTSVDSGAHPLCRPLKAFFRGLLDFEDISVACDAEFVRGMYRCCARHPCVGPYCDEVILRRIRAAMPMRLMRADDVSIWGCVLRRGLQRIHSWMGTGLALGSLYMESRLISLALFASNSADLEGNAGDYDLPGFAKLSEAVAMKGSIFGLEALFRGTSGRRLLEPDFLVSQYCAIRMILLLSSLEVVFFVELLSMVVTAHKLTRRLIRAPEFDSGGYPAHTLACSIISVLKALMVSTPPGSTNTLLDAHRMQTFLIVSASLQPILRKIRVSGHFGWQDAQIQLASDNVVSCFESVPDCDRRPGLWAAIVEDFGVHHGGLRLLPGCGNLACDNLTGAVDRFVETKLCSGCRRTRYCSVECQRADWVVGRHRRVCGRGWWKCGDDVL